MRETRKYRDLEDFEFVELLREVGEAAAENKKRKIDFRLLLEAANRINDLSTYKENSLKPAGYWENFESGGF